MKIIVTCQECGIQICQAIKPVVTNEDLDLYEKSAACAEHGGNIYNYEYQDVEILDENEQSFDPPQFESQRGALLSSTIVVKAFKVQE